MFTIGHSTRNLDEFIEILRCYSVLALIDVRHFPRSRRNPQFDKNNLEIKLPESDIQYYWIEELGGFRECRYGNYMDSEDFKSASDKLMTIDEQKRTTIMCAVDVSILGQNSYNFVHRFILINPFHDEKARSAFQKLH